MIDKRLKPCSRCGGHPVIIDDEFGWGIRCDKCGMTVFEPFYEHARMEWNEEWPSKNRQMFDPYNSDKYHDDEIADRMMDDREDD